MAAMRRPVRRNLPTLAGWAEGLPEAAFSWTVVPLSSRLRGIRVEEFMDAGNYVLRAELPGLDPDQDISVEVDRGVMTIRAERRQEHHERATSEFRYGTLTRRVALPANTDESGISASYEAGILQITVPVREGQTERRAVPVQRST